MKKKVCIALVTFIVLVCLCIFVYKTLNKELKEEPIETITCTLNNKIYSFDIYFDKKELVYKTNISESLNVSFIYKSEEEISNIITSIYENKGAVCCVNSNISIDIDF